MKNLQDELLKAVPGFLGPDYNHPISRHTDENGNVIEEEDVDGSLEAHLKFKAAKKLPLPEELGEKELEIYELLQQQIAALSTERGVTLEDRAKFAILVMQKPEVLEMFHSRGFGAEKATISPDPTEEQVEILMEDLMGSGDPNNYTLECWTEQSTRMIDLSKRYFSPGDAEVLAAWLGKPQLR
jgi:hypothetical protein